MPIDNLEHRMREPMEKERKTVKFEYRIVPSYTTYSASGAFGGLNAFGEITINFFYERGAIPKSQEFEILPNGRLATTPKSEDKVDAVIRNVLFGVSISPDVAKSLATWLNQKVKEYNDRLTSQEKK
jgi:hypothetical protein